MSDTCLPPVAVPPPPGFGAPPQIMPSAPMSPPGMVSSAPAPVVVVTNQASPPPVPADESGFDDTTAGRKRRTIYCFAVTGVSLSFAMVVTMLRPDTELAHMAVSSFTDLASTVSVLYVGGSVLDHSNILGLIGRRIYRGPMQ